MDVKEFSETLNPLADSRTLVATTGSILERRSRRCVLSVIDELLTVPGIVSGEETDLLLDLRWLLREQNDAEGTLRVFCDLRRRLEHREYLAFFRIRRWLEANMDARVRLSPDSRETSVPLRLDHYCVEAVRRVCLCAAIKAGEPLVAPRLSFRFAPVNALSTHGPRR